MKPVIVIFSLCLSFAACSQGTPSNLVSEDFTKENLFTENIEGPNFDKQGNLYVVNFKENGTVGQVHEDGTVTLFITLPTGSTANAIQFNKADDMLLADYTGHNILKVDMKTKAISIFCHNPDFNQPNDICINAKGQLFASDPNWSQSTGKLWRIDTDGKAILLASETGTTNGIELSPDESTLYVNESVQRKVWSFSVDQAGNISNKKLFFEFPDFGLDGMKCDAQGNLYVSRHGKGVIAVLSPEGKLLYEIQLKGKKVSNLTFGGADGKTIYATLQDRKGIEKVQNPIAGKKIR